MDTSDDIGSVAAIARKIARANLVVQVAAEQARQASERLTCATREMLQEIEELTLDTSFAEPDF